ncbi:MAG: T9SS type A sorting domain-containing protein [Bacteroidales bacterium]|nr:T9SS type A sorting domain-containing protein [Bacteroidales bacterium]
MVRILPLRILLSFFPLFLSGSLFAIHQNSDRKHPDFGHQLKFPWAGGLNSCQFCALDLNLDGIQDLIIFDRHGNRKLTFLNHGTAGTIDYTFHPEYANQLPDLHDWVITADYNCDGKMDIFTYGWGGIRVFENISDTILKFKLKTDLLTSYYYSGYVGILLTPVDYPAMEDIDGDGDLDLLTFFGFGSYVEYHKNLSMEKFGNCDSLDYRLTDHCWGKFKESEEGNHIQLNAPCPFPDFMPRHTGSTMLALDLNGDGLKDLIVGDIDYPGVDALINGGTLDSAFMVSQDTLFPFGTKPIHLFSFPVLSYLDLDNDGRRDLIVSPFDPSLYIADNYNNVWFYKNTGTNNHPIFEFQTDHLFHNEMMDFGSNSYPVFFDFDQDGLEDLFVGNYGIYDSSYYSKGILHSAFTSQIAWFKNTGTTSNPVFEYVTDDFAGISSLHLAGAYPAFGDLNGDHKPDLLVGNSDGTLIFFQNLGSSEILPEFGPPEKDFQQIQVGNFSTPQIFDLDKDGLPDLVIGEQAGNLNYYTNQGTATDPQFHLVTDSLGKVNVTNYNLSYDGFSTPCFFRLPDESTRLLVGSDEGIVFLFDSIDNHLGGKFVASTDLFQLLGKTFSDTLYGWRTSAAIGHLSDSIHFDMMVGNFSGGLNWLSAKSTAVIIPGIDNPEISRRTDIKIFPNPADDRMVIEFTQQDSPLHLEMIDIFGRTVQKCTISNSAAINTSSLPNGIYLIRTGSACKKIMIRHP